MSNESDTNQTIRRGKHEKDYLVIGNALAQNRNLSYEARGLLIELLSRPTDWEAKVSALQIKGSAGRDKVKRILQELIDNGYIKDKERVRNEDGTFFYTPYIVNEQPLTENPLADNPLTVNPQLQSTERQSKEKQKDTNVSTSDDVAGDSNSDNGAIQQNDIPIGASWDEYLDLIKRIFPNGGKAPQHIANMLRGRSKTGEYADYNQEPPVSYAELEGFEKWYKQTYPDQAMVSAVKSIDDYLGRYRDKQAKPSTYIEPEPRPEYDGQSLLIGMMKATGLYDDDIFEGGA